MRGAAPAPFPNAILSSMLTLFVLLAAIGGDPLASNAKAIAALERSVAAYGGARDDRSHIDIEKDLKLTLSIRADAISEGQSLAVLPPFESYPLRIDAKIDRPGKRQRMVWDSSIAGDFRFVDVTVLQDGKGFALGEDLKTWREVASEPPTLNRFLPHRLVAQVLQNRASLRWLGSTDGEESVFAGMPMGLMTLHFDAKNGLLKRAERITSYGIFGDGTQEAVFEDYRRVGALQLPARLRVRTRNSVHGALETVYHYDARAVAEFDAKELAIPEGYTKADFSWRGPFTAKPLAKDVYLFENVTGTTGQWSYNVLAVVFDEFVLVAEAPAGNETTDKVLEKLRELAPGKPVRYLVQSHHHSDHIAGIRSYIAEGTTILTGESVKPLIEKIAAAPTLLAPDRLMRDPKAPKIETVKEPRTIRDAHHEVVIYNIGPNPHARDMLIVHLPSEKILWQSDMVNEGEYPPNAATKDFTSKVGALGLKYEQMVGLHGRAKLMSPP